MALKRGLEGRDQLLKLVQRHAREIQERHRAGLQLGESYTSHGSCLLSLYCDVRGASYQKESGINSTARTNIAVVSNPRTNHDPARAHRYGCRLAPASPATGDRVFARGESRPQSAAR